MGKTIDLTGQKFGKLTALSYTGRSSVGGGRIWLCQCECGNFREVSTHNLRALRGGIKACKDCAENASLRNREKFTQETQKEQRSVRRERLHGIWQTMKSRCNNPSSKAYVHYGARGIKVCKKWNDSYHAFKDWALSNGYNDSLTIERRDVDGDYCAENCTWIPMRQQFFNTSRSHIIYFEGKKIPVSKMVYDLGLDYSKVVYYLKSYEQSE